MVPTAYGRQTRKLFPTVSILLRLFPHFQRENSQIHTGSPRNITERLGEPTPKRNSADSSNDYFIPSSRYPRNSSRNAKKIRKKEKDTVETVSNWRIEPASNRCIGTKLWPRLFARERSKESIESYERASRSGIWISLKRNELESRGPWPGRR